MAVLNPVASAIYGPSGKISSSLSFPYQLGNGYSSGKRGVLVYDISNIVTKGRTNTFQCSISCRFHAELVKPTIQTSCSIGFVDNTLENILGDTLNLSNVNPGDYQNGSFGVSVIHKINEPYEDEDVSASNTASVGITTARYMVVIFNYVSGNYYGEAEYVTGFSISYTGAGTNPLYSIESTYPVDVNVKNNVDQIFTWRASTATPPPLVKHILKYRKKGTSQFTSLTVSDGNRYQTVVANTFDVYKYEYKIEEYTYYDLFLVESGVFEFNSIGQDAAPTITGVNNNSIPTVSWTSSNQDAFEVRVRDSEQNIIYNSGLLTGTNQSYRIPQFFKNGTYIVEIRELNIYGLYSDWGSREFTINPSAINKPSNIYVTTNNKYGIEISGTPTPGSQSTYVVRRKVGSEDIEVLGIYSGGIFVDYTGEGDSFYEYTLRSYNVAFADGDWIPLQVKTDEIVLQDGRDLTNYIDIKYSEETTFNLRWSEERNRILFNCLGREFPVREQGEWINSVRTFKGYVKETDIQRLREMNLNAEKVYFKSHNEYFACDMAIEDNGAYVSGGRIITFTMTRISDDERVSII